MRASSVITAGNVLPSELFKAAKLVINCLASAVLLHCLFRVSKRSPTRRDNHKLERSILCCHDVPIRMTRAATEEILSSMTSNFLAVSFSWINAVNLIGFTRNAMKTHRKCLLKLYRSSTESLMLPVSFRDHRGNCSISLPHIPVN